MTLAQQIITIELCVLGTMTTRFLPFLVFRENREIFFHPQFSACWYQLQEEPSAIYYCYIFVKRPMHQNQPQIHLPVFSFSGFQD